MDTELFQHIKRKKFFIILAVFLVSYFNQKNYRRVNDINPALLREPVQIAAESREQIKFVKDGYEYSLTPLYHYEINAFLAGIMDYRLFNVYQNSSVFPVDLCLIWGDNVRNRLYKSQSVRFSQDCRFCLVSWPQGMHFNPNEMSNNHLLVKDERILSKIKGLAPGDQLKLKGALVNVEVKAIGKPVQATITWRTSTSRADDGAGACEVIYVEDIEVLKRANILWRVMYKISFYALVLLIIWNVIILFRPLPRTQSRLPA